MLNSSLADEFMRLAFPEREARLKELSPEELEALNYMWSFWARPNQLAPPGDWRIWLILAGRGFGKTRVGAEWCRHHSKTTMRLNIAGPTADDARDIMIEGESGILAVCPKDERPQYVKHARKLVWPSGCVSLILTADEPDRFRGKQHEKFWGDEVAAWRYPEAWDQAMFGLRLGLSPQALVTTTPRPIPLIKELMKDPHCVVVGGRTLDNASNLAPGFLSDLMKKYKGTRLGRQELDAEVLDDAPGALWTRELIERHRVSVAPANFRRIVVALDPSGTNAEEFDRGQSAEAGIVAAGIGEDGHAYVLEDASKYVKPAEWARISVELYKKLKADRVVGEANNGGAMIEALIRVEDPNISYKSVHASRGKFARAEPISSLYEQGKVHHVGVFAQLEDQMCTYDPKTAKRSPDRLDALVWAITDLAIDEPMEGTNLVGISHWRRWTLVKPPRCDEIICALALTSEESKLTGALVLMGVFTPETPADQKQEPRPAAIVLGYREVIGAAGLHTALAEWRSQHKPDKIVMPRLPALRWLVKSLRRDGASISQVRYDVETGPALSFKLVIDGHGWLPDKPWASALANALSRFPNGPTDVVAHATAAGLHYLRRLHDVASTEPLGTWYDTDETAAEPPEAAIYG